jgi:mRNA-degrading endonuclease RelE of RelBE toxin-antitoxin system
MSFKIILTPNFKKEAKRLAKKYQSLKSDSPSHPKGKAKEAEQEL